MLFFSCLLNEWARKRPCDGLVHCAMRCWWDVDGVRDHGSWLTQNSRARTRFVMCKLRKRKKARTHTEYANTHSLVHFLRSSSSFFSAYFYGSIYFQGIYYHLFTFSLSRAPDARCLFLFLRLKFWSCYEQSKKKQGKKWVNLCVALVPKLYLLVGNFLCLVIFNLPTDLLW